MYFIFQFIYVAPQLIQQPMLKLPIRSFHEFVIKSDCFLKDKTPAKFQRQLTLFVIHENSGFVFLGLDVGSGE